MFKKLIRKLVRKVGVKGVAGEIVAEKLDDVVTGAADAVTGELASKIERKVKGRRRKRTE